MADHNPDEAMARLLATIDGEDPDEQSINGTPILRFYMDDVPYARAFLRKAGYALVPVEPVYQGLACKLWEATKTDWQATIKHVLTEPTCPTVVLVPEDPSYPTVRAGADDIDEAVRLACERALAMVAAAQEGLNMLHDYNDIRSRIPEEPKWWDESGVPRYVDFAPNHLANIYANEAALVLIACQACHTEFRVAFSNHSLGLVFHGADATLSESIRSGRLHYGDPPNVGCCPAGATMNCDDLRVLGYWRRKDFAWVRDSTLEIDLPDMPGYAAQEGGEDG